jgi:hypothetical protein
MSTKGMLRLIGLAISIGVIITVIAAIVAYC